MYNIIEEINNIKEIIIKNTLPEDFILEIPKLRRTHTVCCKYCNSLWGEIAYDRMSRHLVCNCCAYKIKKSVKNRKNNVSIILKTIENKKLVLEQIKEIGLQLTY